MKNLIKPTLALLFFIALYTLPTQVAAQLNQDATSPFSITIEIDSNNTTLRCNGGCDWKKIILKQGSTIISENGIATAKNANSDVLYLFNVQKTEKGIRLNNLKGTQWKEAIDISCNSKCTLVVNQFGLAQ